MLAVKKISLILLISITSILSFNTRSYAQNQNWLQTALQLQREIDFDVPLNQASFIGTHNSYNSQAYQIPLVRYLDPNQTLSLYEQLEAGVRSLELDVHWTLNKKFRKELLLCHGRPNHFGCSLYDRPFAHGLQEIRDWLLDHPDEIVLLYIERHVDNHDLQMVNLLNQYLGRFIFRTTAVDSNSNKCLALPTTLTKADIRRAKKQLIIVTKECDHLKSAWNDLIFTGIGAIRSIPFSFIDATITDFESYPGCSKNTIFSPDTKHTSLWRIYEDRTMTGSMRKRQKKIYSNEIKTLMRCGINWPTMDGLQKHDDRFFGAIWSWVAPYPMSGKGNCAYYQKDSGIMNAHCQETKPGFACVSDDVETLQVAAVAGSWQDGDIMCQLVFGNSFHFATPINSVGMDSLKLAMNKAHLSSVWLNYALSKDKWRANLINAEEKKYG